ncbi:MAG: M23 family metallopeptidase [Gemmatimonadetes bacterium]|nr:M23 family metallopeptidase [Gemmatimonadota bacterium]MYG23520.1 M23 family metallopeptidase [Gemmatimonadota bacterium]MYJ38800.1 M23 family metallopeptidase [Gemmatimonadota bacterium]
MKNDRWTVLFFREDTTDSRQFSLPAPLVRRCLTAGCVLGVFLLGATAFFLFDTGARVRAAHLARENRLLEAEIERVRVSVDELDREMATLAEKDRRVRLVAGLLEIDEEVFEVGVGGPGLDSPDESELWALDRETSEAAYAVRYDLAVLLRRADLLSRSFSETEASLEGQAERLKHTPSILPIHGPVSSAFSVSRRHPVHRIYMPHDGIDQRAARGTRFVATADGVVKFSGWKPGYGNTVEIDHGFGVTTLYAHASKLLVSAGTRVSRDDVIGQIGCTGTCTGPHVHYEVHVNGRPVDPMTHVLLRTAP